MLPVPRLVVLASATKNGPLAFDTEPMDGREYVTVSYRSGPQSASQLAVKVWFDPARGFIPVREQDKQGAKTIQFDIGYTRDATYGFVPTSWTFSDWVTPGKPLNVHQVTVARWKINPSVAAKTFAWTFRRAPTSSTGTARLNTSSARMGQSGSSRSGTGSRGRRTIILNSGPARDLDRQGAKPPDAALKPAGG